MDWMQSIQKAINFIENNLLGDLDIESITSSVYSSSSNFQRIFNIITGITIGDYIRFRRLSQAGRELIETKDKIADIAIKYRYETPESFSKAFQRFHGVAPSEAKRLEYGLKYFNPLSIEVFIKGGFIMERKLIPNVLKLYEVKSENYTFPSCMHSAMTALNEDNEFDFTFFAGITGDLFSQVWNTPKWSYNDSYSSVCREGTEKPINAAFTACGYDYELIGEDEIKGNKQKYVNKIIDSVNNGYPVLSYGIVGPPICSLICGYDNNGNILIGRSQFIDVPVNDDKTELKYCEDYFQTKNGLQNSEALIFIKGKKDLISVRDSIQKSIDNIPKLAQMPPSGYKRPSLYGRQAFDAWANSLLNDEDFQNEDMLTGPLDTYGSCMVMVGTNMHYIINYLDKAERICPYLKTKIDKLKILYTKERDALEKLVEFQGGYFFEKKDKLLNREFRVKLAEHVREICKRYMDAALHV